VRLDELALAPERPGSLQAVLGAERVDGAADAGEFPAQAELMRLRGVVADVIHLDAGHEEASVAADLRAWWPIRSAMPSRRTLARKVRYRLG
jgi:hypothetical protein